MSKPEYRENLDRLGQQLGTDGDRLLQDVREQARSASYPDDDCYLPDEVAAFERTGALPADRLGHIDKCVGCRALLQALVPNPDLVREFREEVMRKRLQEQMAAYPLESVDSGIFPLGSQLWLHRVPVALAVALLLCVGGLYRYSQQPSMGNISRATTTIMNSGSSVSVGSTESIQTNSHQVPPETSVAVAEFTNSGSPTTVRLKRTVMLKRNGNFASESWATIAATAVVSEGASKPSTDTSGTKEGFVNISLSPNDMLEVSNAVASACNSFADGKNVGQSGSFKFLLQKKLEALKSDPGTKVTFTNIDWDGKSGDIQILNNDHPAALLNPDNTLKMTQQYVDVLQATDGNPLALDKAMGNVTLSFTPDKSGKRLPN